MQQGRLQGAARFRIERELADTLQGRIYAGTDLLTGKQVVIKEAWRQLVHSGRSRKGHRVPEDFVKERQLILKLTNLQNCTDGIVKGIDEWDDEHCYYYAMEYCEGELFDYISKTHTQPDYRKYVDAEASKEQIAMQTANQWVKNVAKMFKQICLAVQFLHSHGYCHLDLSLENTMIYDLNTLAVKVIDFGLMQKFKNGNFQFHGRVGKLQYMCPEAYSRSVYDARAADVYCLGVMLFMMLIGAPPYQAPQPQNAAFGYFVSGRIADVLKHWKRLRLITVDALDLLNKMFRYENTRISLDEVLKHKFFTGIDDAVDVNQANVEQKNDANNQPQKPLAEPIMESESTPQYVGQDAVQLLQDNKENEDNNSNNNSSGNMYCDLLLQTWNLEQIASKLLATGWNIPADWKQLNETVLEYEIGLSKQEAVLFMKKYYETFGGAPTPKQNEDKPNAQNNVSNKTHQKQQTALKPQIQQQMSMSPQPNENNNNNDHQQQQQPASYQLPAQQPHAHHHAHPHQHPHQQPALYGGHQQQQPYPAVDGNQVVNQLYDPYQHQPQPQPQQQFLYDQQYLPQQQQYAQVPNPQQAAYLQQQGYPYNVTYPYSNNNNNNPSNPSNQYKSSQHWQCR